MKPDCITAHFKGLVGTFYVDAKFEIPLLGVTALFGPSGSGKTTILRCIAGLTRLQGELKVGSWTWQDSKQFTPTHLRSIGYAFQHAELFPHLTVAGNLAFAGKYSDRRQGHRSRINKDDIVALLGLEPLLNRQPNKLSGGERQRVSIARALLSQPRILLMDEPLASLDQAAKEEILPYIESLNTTSGIPVIYVSHDIGEVARLADRVLQISEGQVVGMGPIGEMIERLGLDAGVPAFEESALLKGRIASHDQTNRITQIDLSPGELAAPNINLPVGQEVRVRVRARDVAVALERPRAISIRNILSATVAECVAQENMGSADIILDIGDQRLRARITLASLSDLNLQPGQQVYALIKSVTFDGR